MSDSTKHISELVLNQLQELQQTFDEPKTQLCLFCKEPLSKSDIELRNSKSCWDCSLEQNHEDGFYLEEAGIEYEEYENE